MSAPAPNAAIAARTLGRRRSPAVAALAALRPRQWVKNLVLFAGLIFAARQADGTRWLEAGTAFGAYCVTASAAYLVNDVRDADADRLHPVKRLRPVAAGALSPRAALSLALVLLLAGCTLAGSLGARSLTYLASFVLLQLAYTMWLKRLAFVDIGLIAIFFVIRAAAGAAAVHVRISPWLLACTALLALFLGLAKRRGELMLVRRGSTSGRSSLARYSVSTVEHLLWAAAAAALTAYTIYTLVAHDSHEMALTVPLAGAGIVRYLHLVYSRDLREAPEYVLLSDRLLLATVGAWVVTTAVILGGA